MEVIPSLDLYKGNVVRFIRGDPNSVKVYSKDPAAKALEWQQSGAERLHVVDLDAALGTGDNEEVVRRVLDSVDMTIQVGGGVRDIARASSLIEDGADIIVVGTRAVTDERFVPELLDRFGAEKVMVAVDYRGSSVVVKGWKSRTAIEVGKALDDFVKKGVEKFLLTNVERDGTLSGPDLATLEMAVRSSRREIVASGGVSSIDDLKRLSKIRVSGAIVGMALYEGSFTLEEAQSLLKDEV